LSRASTFEKYVNVEACVKEQSFTYARKNGHQHHNQDHHDFKAKTIVNIIIIYTSK